MKITTREEAREQIKEAGITTDNVTAYQLEALLKQLRICLKESDCYDGHLSMFNRKYNKFTRCNSHIWERREAISFNRDGFIGIAGWADSTNVQPFLKAISIWLELIKSR